MIRPRAARLQAKVWPFILFLSGLAGGIAAAQNAAPASPATPGQFFTITEPITHETKERIRGATRQLVDRSASSETGSRPILVFEFQAGETAPGSSEFGACYDLANLISRELAGAKLTVAFVPQPLKGYAVLPALACTEIVMGSSASLGPITPEGQPFDPALREPVRFLAIRKTRDPELLLGMLDRDADLRRVRTVDKAIHYVLAENKQKFLETHQQILEEKPAWDAGQRGTLTAQRARDEGFCTRNAESPKELATMYQLSGRSAIDDPTLGQAIRPDWIELKGALDSVAASMLKRNIEEARQAQGQPSVHRDQQPRRHGSRQRPHRRPALRDQGHEDRRLRRRPRPGRGGAPAAGVPRHRVQEGGEDGRRPPDELGPQWPAARPGRRGPRQPGQQGGILGPRKRTSRGRRPCHGQSRRRGRGSTRFPYRRVPAAPEHRGRSRSRPLPGDRYPKRARLGPDHQG